MYITFAAISFLKVLSSHTLENFIPSSYRNIYYTLPKKQHCVLVMYICMLCLSEIVFDSSEAEFIPALLLHSIGNGYSLFLYL